MIGKTVSHYRILERLGAGGMGVVYKAEDTRLKRTVALKFLPPDLTREQSAKTRFIHEAQAASALQHHNICTIHEIDETPEGQLFISMDCYQGETLKEKIARGPLPVEEAVDIASQVVAGLSKAHEAGMVHRDIKPANIMVTTDGVVKLLDFGLAKLAGQTKLTKTGTTVGTVSYMSPEQARGDEVDARSDIFSLGAVLYEMLTGVVPFPGVHEAAVLYGIIHGEPEPVAGRRKDVPRGIGGIVEKALQKDPGERYQRAEDLRRDLAAAGGASSSAVGARGFSAKRKRRIAAAVLGAVAIAALVWKFAPITSNRTTTGDLALAIVDFRDLATPGDSIQSAAITSLVHVGLVETSPIQIKSPSYLYDLRRRLFGSARGPIGADQALELARKSGASFALSGQLTRIAGGPCLLWDLVRTKDGRSLAARRAEGSDIVEIADKVIAGVLPILGRESGARGSDGQEMAPSSVAAISTSSPEAYRRYAEGMLLRDVDAVRALQSFSEAVKLDSTFALAYLEMSRLYLGPRGISEDNSARRLAEKAWRLRSRLGIKDRMRLEAQRALIDDRVVDVLATDREMLARWPDDKEILSGFAEHLFWWWCGEEGASVTGRAVELYPDDLNLRHSHVILLMLAGRRKEALESAKINAQRHPEDPLTYMDLGDSYLRLGLPDSAEASYRRSFSLGIPQNETLECLARCGYSKGNNEEAARLYRKILDMSDLPAGVRITHLSSYPRRIGAAGVLAESGRFKEAIDAFEKERPNAAAEPRTAGIFEYGYNRVLLGLGRYHDVLSWAQGREHASSGLYRQASWYVATASIALGSLDGARAALVNLESMDRDGYRKARQLICSVEAQIAIAEGKPDEALAALTDMGRNGGYWEPWTFVQWKEMTARAYVMAGRLDEAVATHQEILQIYGGHALSHYELGQIYEEAKRPADAKREYAKFLEMWSGADEGLPQLVEARRRIAKL